MTRIDAEDAFIYSYMCVAKNIFVYKCKIRNFDNTDIKLFLEI